MSHNLHSNHRIRGINAAIVSMMLHSRVCHITLRMNFNLTQHWFSLDTKPKECSTTRFPVTVDMYERAIEHKTTASVWGCCLNNIICFRPNRSTTIMMFVTRRLVEKLGGSSYSFVSKRKRLITCRLRGSIQAHARCNGSSRLHKGINLAWRQAEASGQHSFVV